VLLGTWATLRQRGAICARPPAARSGAWHQERTETSPNSPLFPGSHAILPPKSPFASRFQELRYFAGNRGSPGSKSGSLPVVVKAPTAGPESGLCRHSHRGRSTQHGHLPNARMGGWPGGAPPRTWRSKKRSLLAGQGFDITLSDARWLPYLRQLGCSTSASSRGTTRLAGTCRVARPGRPRSLPSRPSFAGDPQAGVCPEQHVVVVVG
jgi:hypothetical protein